MERGQLKVGAGRAVLDIPASLFPIEGYSGIHDDLHARAILLDNGINRAAIVVVELTSLSPAVSDHLRKIISREGDVAFENIILCASHTFTAPHPKIEDDNYDENILFYYEQLTDKDSIYVEVLTKAIISSTRQAKERMQPGRMGFGSGQCNVNVNRDVLTPKGWWKGNNFEGPSDKTISVIKFETLEGKPVALLINYPVPSWIISKSGTRLVSADLGGAVARYAEEQYGGEMVALWNIGAAGDQLPLFRATREFVDKDGNFGSIDIPEAGYLLIELMGGTLGCEAVRISENIRNCSSDVTIKTINKTVTCPGQEIIKNAREIVPSREYRFRKTNPKQIPFSIMTLDNIAVIAVQVELNCRTSLQIKAASPFQNTVIMTMANGAAKYLPDAESYDKITYESMYSMYAKGSAEILRDEIISALDNAVFL